jgi:DnaJ-class molecular chaperone
MRNGKHQRKDLVEDSYMSRSYERDEDWLMTCPECHGQGTIGSGDNRVRCSRCNGAGKIKR